MQIEATPFPTTAVQGFHPSLYVPRTARNRATDIAGLGRRTAAYLIDIASLAAIAVAVLIFASAYANVAGSGLAPVVVAGIATSIGAFAYFPVLESRCGQTIGKRAMRIKLVSADGAPVTRVQCWKRQVAWLFDGIAFAGLYLEARSARHQRLGDILADTVVVNA